MDARSTSGWVAWLSIFTSTGTLVCCALPAALVAAGAGATLVGLVGTFPQLIWLSEHKVAIFSIAAAMLAAAGYLQHRARFAPCPTQPAAARACEQARRLSLRIYWVSMALFAVGVVFAFVLPALSAP